MPRTLDEIKRDIAEGLNYDMKRTYLRDYNELKPKLALVSLLDQALQQNDLNAAQLYQLITTFPAQARAHGMWASAVSSFERNITPLLEEAKTLLESQGQSIYTKEEDLLAASLEKFWQGHGQNISDVCHHHPNTPQSIYLDGLLDVGRMLNAGPSRQAYQVNRPLLRNILAEAARLAKADEQPTYKTLNAAVSRLKMSKKLMATPALVADYDMLEDAEECYRQEICVPGKLTLAKDAVKKQLPPIQQP